MNWFVSPLKLIGNLTKVGLTWGSVLDIATDITNFQELNSLFKS